MDVKQIIKALGGAAAVAKGLGMPGDDVGAKAVRAWVLRESIPARWFTAVERLAIAKGLDGITTASLAQVAEQRRLNAARGAEAA